MTRRMLALSALMAACGPSASESSTGGEGQSDSVGAKLDVPAEDGTSTSGTSTGRADGCTEVIEGDFEVTDESDFEWLRGVREVEGGLTVTGLSTQESLEFLGCLERVKGLWIRDTEGIRSMEGLGRLELIDGEFSVSGNSDLETLAGLDALETVEWGMWVLDNHELSRFEIHTPTRVPRVRLGWYECEKENAGFVSVPRGDNPKLKAIDGFELVQDVDFVIEGQSGFESTQAIVDIFSGIEIGVGNVFPSAEFHFNPRLTAADLSAVYEVLGMEFESLPPSIVCGNGGDDNECPCKGGA